MGKEKKNISITSLQLKVNILLYFIAGTPPSDEVPAGEYPTEITQDSGATVLVVQEYTFGKYLGYFEVTFNDEGEVTAWEGNPILLNDSYEEGSFISILRIIIVVAFSAFLSLTFCLSLAWN